MDPIANKSGLTFCAKLLARVARRGTVPPCISQPYGSCKPLTITWLSTRFLQKRKDFHSSHMLDLGKKVPEIQFDLIGRLFPGILVLAAYSGKNNLPQTITAIALALVASYVIGFTLELTSKAIVDLGLINWWLKKIDRKEYGPWPMVEDAVWTHYNTTDGPKHEVVFKMLAERTMFRSLALMSVVASIHPPRSVQHCEWSTWLSVLLFWSALYWNSRWVSCIVDVDKELIKAKAVKTHTQ
jgi:hypothetical protein